MAAGRLRAVLADSHNKHGYILNEQGIFL